MEVVISLSQGRIAAAQCGLFTYKSVPVIFEPTCSNIPQTCAPPIKCEFYRVKDKCLQVTSCMQHVTDCK